MIRQRLNFYLAGVVSVTAFIVYLSALQNEFIQWDDNLYVFENQHIRSLDAAFFRWAFFDFYAGNWHPLTWMSHALDYAIWGLNPLGHHLTNNILHAVNTFVVVLLVVRLIKNSPPILGGVGEGRGGNWTKNILPDKPPLPLLNQGGEHDERAILIVAATTGLLFGLHPLHVESVAWVSERKDLLCALFFLLSVMMYLRASSSFPLDGKASLDTPVKPEYDGNKSVIPRRDRGIQFLNKQYLLSLLFFILALLSKPMAVTLPLVLLILDWYPFERVRSLRTFRTAFIEKLPFIALSLVSSVLTVQAQGAGGAIKSTEFAPLPMRMLVGIKALIVYLWKIVLPVDLVPFYPYPKEASLVSLEYLSAIALVIGITITCIVMAKRQKLWLSAWGYYVILLIPVLGIVQVGEQSMADRYVYLPSLGPFLLIGLATAWVWARITRLERGSSIAMFLAVGASVLVIISLSYATFKQTGIWKNSIVFWSYVIEKEPERVLLAYLNRGIAFEKIGQINRAIADYDKAIAIDPLYFEAYNNRGVLYGQAGMFDKAIEYFNKSIGINPNFEDAYVNRGIAYALAGQYGRALEDFDKAILLDQNSAKAYVNRGNLYLRIGNKSRALSDFLKACELGNEDGCARSVM